ncbi:Hypothetical_protein [Hexamita inflata]|uniref:Hypothetical_protein n=1 Tax=Hexamita inflata TaxID=28002 RepID=A0AA86P1X5_9EUKA|nr:Hypothetical protein HINF_LOCUS18762 [Hexamita inflata]
MQLNQCILNKFIEQAQVILYQSNPQSIQKLTVDILLLPDRNYTRFWNELSFALNTCEQELKNIFSVHFTSFYLVKSHCEQQTQKLSSERFQNNLVSAISKIFGDVPEINDIKNLVIDKEEEIWSQMSKSTGKTEKEIAQFYFQTDEFKSTHSYKLSQEDKTRIIQINNKYPEMKPNKIIDQFLNERTSNYKIARKNAVMFVVHNRLRQKKE